MWSIWCVLSCRVVDLLLADGVREAYGMVSAVVLLIFFSRTVFVSLDTFTERSSQHVSLDTFTERSSQHVPCRTAATHSGSSCGTVVQRKLEKERNNMRVNLLGTLIGIEFVFELFLRFAFTPNPKEYSSFALEIHKNQS